MNCLRFTGFKTYFILGTFPLVFGLLKSPDFGYYIVFYTQIHQIVRYFGSYSLISVPPILDTNTRLVSGIGIDMNFYCLYRYDRKPDIVIVIIRNPDSGISMEF